MSKCDCQWQPWIPRCYGHCKIKNGQTAGAKKESEVERRVRTFVQRWVSEIKDEVEDVPKGKPEVILSVAKEDAAVSDIKVDAAVPPEPVQLLDLSTIDEKTTASDSKSAAQVFMEEKVEKSNARQKMGAKLALLEEVVKLGRQLLEQTRTLKRSKEALLLRKVRVAYNKCHKFWRGKVISAHKSDVDKQVDAAKARLGIRKRGIQFDNSVMSFLMSV